LEFAIPQFLNSPIKTIIDHLIQLPLNDLQSEAFRIRKSHFGNELTFSIPGTISYHDDAFPSQKDRFAAISITGSHCDLRCGHCKGKLLEPMIPAENPQTFLQVAERLRLDGAHGILVSGGADQNGEVPLKKVIPSIRELKERAPEFKVIAHTGLIGRETAEELKEARVDQILIDVIGDDNTIREVYHLNKRVEDYEEALWTLKEMGHRPCSPYYHRTSLRRVERRMESLGDGHTGRCGDDCFGHLQNLECFREKSFQSSETGRNIKGFCHCSYSQSRHSHSTGLHPSGPSLEGRDGKGIYRLRSQHHRPSFARDNRLRKRNTSQNKIHRDVL
jgi:hypothetical protein